MTWAKLDDSFPEHPKILSVSLKARWLQVTAICYCARNLTDGEIPKAMLPLLGGTPALAKELVQAALWDTTSRGSWVVHDFLDYNPSRAEVEAERQRKAAAGQAGGKAAAKARATGKGEARATSSATGSSSTPDPYPSASTEADQGAPAPQSRRRISEAEISRWEGENPDLDIPRFVNDYLNWSGSSKHKDQVRGFENQMLIGWKREQFRKTKGPVYLDEGIFSEASLQKYREEHPEEFEVEA